MLELLRQIQKIIPVKFIKEVDESIEIIYFSDNMPNESQLDQINVLVSNWPIEKAKNEKIKNLDAEWKQKVTVGWQTSEGYYLGMDVSDITLLTGAFILAKEASAIGINDPISIVDTSGQSHSMNLEDLTLLMLQYGQARALLSNSYAAIKDSIKSATSIEEVNNININL